MKFSTVALAGAATGLAHSTLTERADITDADILNYALTLEHLEAAFYQEGLKNYTHGDFQKAGMHDPFYVNLKETASDEQQHAQFLTKALKAAGAKPVEACTYAFPATDVNTFLALGNILEGVGVSAYLGAAASIMNKTYLTAAGSILTTEARHSAYLRAALGEAPAAQAFDNPLDFNEVYTLASMFIVSCPESNGKLPVKAFPALTMPSMAPATTGSKVELMVVDGVSMDTKNVYAAFITVTGPVWAPLESTGDGNFEVTIPEGVTGQSYVVLTKGNKQASDDNILAGPAIVGQPNGPMGVGSQCSGRGSGSMPSMTSMSVWSSMAMPMPTASMTISSGSMPSMSASASASSTPVFNGANGKSMSGIASVFGALAAVAAFLQ
ncbi:hypothetical protein N7481_001586 [Penicillium waksmanii]|uniref:uncharacterized protein n=1 Tax=Penicillium waksmanii TaxID=69791 RepID=UPI002548E99B|nr:uncharacterized protein N7481_001586 [Penicillium waksmanii]KAJ6001177.1 hypothetical protein N7481_001586 [Penicillium waksmanii]